VGLKPSQGRITAGPAGDENGLGVEFCLLRSVRDPADHQDASPRCTGPGSRWRAARVAFEIETERLVLRAVTDDDVAAAPAGYSGARLITFFAIA
jgi:hypothetical protein